VIELRGAQECFGGNAPNIQTCAAKPLFLDQPDLLAHMRGVCGRFITARACADND
jgi:hypothetical protein